MVVADSHYIHIGKHFQALILLASHKAQHREGNDTEEFTSMEYKAYPINTKTCLDPFLAFSSTETQIQTPALLIVVIESENYFLGSIQN